jgi:class 3 adenylate cyclase/tetratricopeptide (TPR) repeat protein
MKCPKCLSENREGVKFCEDCGAKMEMLCPGCGASIPPGKKFCGECGHQLRKPAEIPAIDYSEPQSYTPKFLADKILTNRSTLEGERKLVTVLFADVANYTSMSEKLDPEEVHQIMDGCFKILMDEIHRYEGTINQFTGDGVMALFGAPVAHEDHAQRACHASLAIQEAVTAYGQRIGKAHGQDFQMRIGLNSGQVIVGAIGDDLRMDYTAVGDTSNLAARMESMAEPGSILVSDNTHKLVGYFFEFDPLGKIQIKGKDQPQEAHKLIRATDVATRIEASLVKGLTELVGRRPEMDILHTAWQKVKSGEGRVVDVVGEAGVGKSRLIYEFQQTIGKEATFLTGVCIQYGRSINFLPLIDVVKAAFGIKEGMSEQEVQQRIEETATESLAAMIPFYLNLLSLKTEDPKFNSLNPEGRKFGTFEAVKDLLVSLSEESPLIVFIEDIHWIDKISEDFFNFFTHSIHGCPIMMLTAYRPEAEPPWTKGAHYRQLGLQTLSAKSSVRLVRNILGDPKLDPNLEEKIVAKTGGNPFFVEEIVRELLERGDVLQKGDRYVSQKPIDQLNIPSSVQGVLAARMDRLSEDLKQTMQVASVIGRDFAYKILRSIMQLGDELRGHLTNLVGVEVLYEKALYPELEYIFKHALTQEVAYDSLLKQRRREIHGRIARTIEELYADRLEQHYELLAHHWELSDSPDRSIEYLVLAGEKSNRNQAANATVDFYTRALKQLEKVGKVSDINLMMQIRAGLADSLHSMGKIEEGFENYQEAMRLAEESEDQPKLLEILSYIPALIYNTTLKDNTPHICERGLELARNLGDEGAEAILKTFYAYWRYNWQGSDEYETFHSCVAMAEKSGQPKAVVTAQGYLSILERWRGNPQRALELIEGFPELLQSMFFIRDANHLNLMFSWFLTELGRYKEALRYLEQGLDIAGKNSLYFFIFRYYNTLGWTYSELYSLKKAFHFNNQALENLIALKKNPAMIYIVSEIRAMTEVNLMENKFEMGKADEAWEDLTRFEEETASSDYDFSRDRWDARMKDLKGVMLLKRGDLDGAEEIVRQGLEVATKRQYKKYIGRAERLSGQILAERAAYDPAEAKLKEALSKLDEVGNPKQLWITHTALARLYKKMNRPDLEREQWQTAASVVKSTADDLEDEELRTTFINAKPVQEILENANP